jgi:hypothetical protein
LYHWVAASVAAALTGEPLFFKRSNQTISMSAAQAALGSPRL